MISLSERRHPAKELYAESREVYKPKCGLEQAERLFLAKNRLLRRRTQEDPTNPGRDRGAPRKNRSQSFVNKLLRDKVASAST
jgi:hypothetical protein